jgi:hypothetical protein
MELARMTFDNQKNYLACLGLGISEIQQGKLNEIKTEKKALLFFELFHQQGTWHCIALIPGEEIIDPYYNEQLLEETYFFLGDI